MLFGASDLYSGDSIMQITVAFNHFGKGLIQRMPRVRWGFVHVVNNDYTHWLMYAIGGSHNPTIISQGNRFIAQSSLFTKEASFPTSNAIFALFVLTQIFYIEQYFHVTVKTLVFLLFFGSGLADTSTEVVNWAKIKHSQITELERSKNFQRELIKFVLL